MEQYWNHFILLLVWQASSDWNKSLSQLRTAAAAAAADGGGGGECWAVPV